MNKLKLVKTVANVIVGAGTTSITNSIIRNNVAPDTLPMQVCVGVASLVIGSMAAGATREHTSDRIDEIVAAWNAANETTEEPIPA